MASVVYSDAGRCGGRRVSLFLLLLSVLQLLASCEAARINRAAFMDGNVYSEVVDPNNSTIMSMFNLTKEHVERLQNLSNHAAKDETAQTIQNRLLDRLAVHRINDIRTRIREAVLNKGDTNHEKAGYPICDASSLNWQQSPNLSLHFASSVFEDNVVSINSAILRLYKLNPKAPAGAAVEQPAVAPLCPEPPLESQIRVTVSIIHQLKKKRKLERKKRICNTMMLSTTKTGWVEIDVKCALNYWTQQLQLQQQQQTQTPAQAQAQAQAQAGHQHLPIMVGQLMIEVHDDEDNQLMPGLYFQPPSCDKADLNVTSSKTLLNKNLDSNNYDRIFYENLKRSIYSPSRSRENTESTTLLNSPTIDNMLENNSENDSQEEREQLHQHRLRHHHSEQLQSADCELVDSSSKDSSQRTQQNHHQHHHHHHHHHHHQQQQHHQVHHNHHKHRHVMPSEE
ncbi:hypothetical protein KR222_001699 [Zaprionus bogoriensis]|nr:hypothetical protein KR222_001699 [Zaprionus bogoriensis]